MLGIYLSMLNSAADQEAFQALYERNKYKVFHAAQGIVKNKLWAEDVVHEAFLYVADHCRPAAAAENLGRGAGVGLRGMEYGGDRGASGTFPAHGAAAAGTGVGDDTGGVERE